MLRSLYIDSLVLEVSGLMHDFFLLRWSDEFPTNLDVLQEPSLFHEESLQGVNVVHSGFLVLPEYRTNHENYSSDETDSDNGGGLTPSTSRRKKAQRENHINIRQETKVSSSINVVQLAMINIFNHQFILYAYAIL